MEQRYTIIRAHRELSARRDIRLFGFTVGWFYLGFMWCPKRAKVVSKWLPD